MFTSWPLLGTRAYFFNLVGGYGACGRCMSALTDWLDILPEKTMSGTFSKFCLVIKQKKKKKKTEFQSFLLLIMMNPLVEYASSSEEEDQQDKKRPMKEERR